jgi:hypothetical protein
MVRCTGACLDHSNVRLDACGPPTPHELAPLDLRLRLCAIEIYRMHMMIIRQGECIKGL